MSLSTIDYIILALYLLIIVGIGVYTGIKRKTIPVKDCSLQAVH